MLPCLASQGEYTFLALRPIQDRVQPITQAVISLRNSTATVAVEPELGKRAVFLRGWEGRVLE